MRGPMKSLLSVALPGLLGVVLLARGHRLQPASAEDPVRVPVPKESLFFDDGDTVVVRWKAGEEETVRMLGIDTPEVLHLEHNLPYPQPFGTEAAGFLAGCIATADKIELLRSAQKDTFGRTLGYLFVNGKNVSVMLLTARLAVESVSRYGDNGLPTEAAACLEAAKAAGPVAFEDPHFYRQRMRAVSTWLKQHGLYPKGEEPAKK